VSSKPVSPAAWLVVYVLFGIVALGASLTGLTSWVTSWYCAPVPTPAHAFSGFETVFPGTASTWRGDLATCAPPVGVVRAVAIVLMTVLILAGVFILVAVLQYRQSDRHFEREMKRRSGFAQGAEIAKWFSRTAVVKRGGRLRPSLASPTAEQVGIQVGTARRTDVHLTVEDSVALIGPPRSGKGRRVLVSMIVDYPGPIVTTSTRPDNLTITRGTRKRLGEVAVFDPQGVSGLGAGLRWSPILGCEDPLVAAQRGQALVAGTSLGRSQSNQEWGERAGVMASALLHAAATGGRGVDSLYEWGANPRLARSAVDILRADGAPGWAEDLDGVLSGDPKLLSSTWFGVSATLAPLRIPSVRDAMSPSAGENFDMDDFLAGQNSLYLIGTGTGAGAAGGFLGGLMDSITEHARRVAQRQAEARLDPPLGLILDEIVNIFSWPALPQLMADGGGSGIQPIVVLQSLSQAEKVWSRADAITIWAAATSKLVLGGASDVDFLGDVEKLLGERKQQQRSRSWNESGSSHSVQESMRSVMTADEIRRMPETMGLMLYRNRRGVLLRLNSWTDRADADVITQDRDETAALQKAAFTTASTPASVGTEL
jgi:type IV secretion system protein VirD4